MAHWGRRLQRKPHEEPLERGSQAKRKTLELGAIVLGLPAHGRACLFDLDGVLTRTAKVHAAAWKEMFDGYLRGRAARREEEFVPFDPVADYAQYVDGKPRYDGVRSFLAARGIKLPGGEPSDPPSAETVCGLGNRKNDLVLALLR